MLWGGEETFIYWIIIDIYDYVDKDVEPLTEIIISELHEVMCASEVVGNPPS